jgi:hypothetical protein
VQGASVRNYPNKVYTYEYINKEKQNKTKTKRKLNKGDIKNLMKVKEEPRTRRIYRQI